MKTKNIDQILSLLLIFGLLAAGLVSAATISPSAPTSIAVERNSTNAYPNGTQRNGTRGYVYEMNISESQPSQKWVGYVGHVNGEYALQDASGNALYDWNIVTTKGELYATKERYATGGPNEQENQYGGGMPTWANVDCANSTMITEENTNYNHTATDEDSYLRTFTAGSGFYNPGFYVGTNPTLDNDSITSGETCYGIYLNYNNTDNSVPPKRRANWTEVVLTDGSYQPADATGHTGKKDYDLIYAVLLQNESNGFDSANYDFQILLPQSGLSGEQPVVAFYFYIELV